MVYGVEQHAAIKPRLKLNSCPNSLPNEPKTNAAHKMANKTFQLWFASWHHPRFLPFCPAPLLGETFIKMKESRKFYRVFRQAEGNSNNNNNFRKSNNKKWEQSRGTHTPTHAHARGLIKKSCGNIPCQNADTNKHSSCPNTVPLSSYSPLDQLTIFSSCPSVSFHCRITSAAALFL